MRNGEPRRGVFKKGATTISDRQAKKVLNGASKAALLDLCVDLLRRTQGNEVLDGPELIAAFREAFGPIAIVRGDRVP